MLLVRQTGAAPSRAGWVPDPAPGPARRLVHGTYATCWVVLYAGTVVTGSGPHAGDVDSPRNGLSPATVSQLHADLVFLLVGLTLGCMAALWAGGARTAARSAAVLLGVELAQGTVGLVQYATDLPVALVAAHLMGASLLTVSATWLWLDIRSPDRTTAGSSAAVGVAQRSSGSIATERNSSAR